MGNFHYLLPHPLRCETCEFHIDDGLWFGRCSKAKGYYDGSLTLHPYRLIQSIGCASHSNAKKFFEELLKN